MPNYFRRFSNPCYSSMVKSPAGKQLIAKNEQEYEKNHFLVLLTNGKFTDLEKLLQSHGFSITHSTDLLLNKRNEESIMSTQPFTHQQLFNLKLETIEERITEYYQETQDGTMTIKLLLALRVRYQLGAQEFALVLKDLVRHLFTRTKVTRTMKHFFWYFQDYFETSEWRLLGLKLFPVRNFVEKTKSLIKSQVAKLLSIGAAKPLEE